MKIRSVISFVLLAAILMLGWRYFDRHRDDFRLITTLSPIPVVLLFVFKLAGALVLGGQLWILTRTYGLKLAFLQAFSLSRLTTFAGVFLPFPGGVSIKAVYLKKFHDFRYTSFIAAISITAIIKMQMFSLVAVTVLLPRGSEGRVLLTLAVVCLATASGFLLLAHRIPAQWLNRLNRFQSLAAEWSALRLNLRAVLYLTLVSTINLGLAILSIYLSFRAFSISVSIELSTVIAVFANLLGTIKLTPGDLGSREFIFAAIAGVYGISVNEGLHAAALHRLIEILCILVLAPSAIFSLGPKETDR